MEVEPLERAHEKGHVTQQIFSPRLEDENSSSVAYLQKIINDPANAIVQHQIQGNMAKMLVMLSTKEQRLIKFEIPKEDCTVHNLLDQVKITFSGETQISLVNNPTLGINYIVEFPGSTGSEMVATSFDSSGSGNCNSIQEIVSSTTSSENLSQNTNASDKNNTSLQTTEVSSSTERGTNIDMEVKRPEHVQEMGHVTQQTFSPRLEDENSTSVAYLQKIINDPANAIVQHQIQGNMAKMLVILSTEEQRLIKFEIPKEDCTVRDLLDQVCTALGKVNITFSSEMQISLVNDPTLGINYIVEFLGSTGTATCFDSSDSGNCYGPSTMSRSRKSRKKLTNHSSLFFDRKENNEL